MEQKTKPAMKKAFLFLSAAVCCLAAYSQQPERIDWNTDLDYLASELPARHYNLFTVHGKEYLLAGIAAIKAESGHVSDLHTALKARQLIASFGDSHTRVHFEPLLDKDLSLPLGVLWVSDGLYVLRTAPEYKELLGQRITAIGNVPIATVTDSLSTLITVDNRACVKSEVPQFLSSFQILEFFGFTDSGQVELTYGENKTCILKPSRPDQTAQVTFKPDSVFFARENRNLLFTDHYFPEDKIYYMLYNSCFSRELAALRDEERAKSLPSFAAFEERAFQTLETRPVDKLIFDMRYNGGGNSSQGTAFVEKLAAFLKKHRHLKIYVVLGRDTFSSAILNAMDFKRLTKATFIGEETAGKPNHFGEVKNLQLPESKLYVMYSTKYFKRTKKETNTIKPDVPIEMSFSDFTKGIDPVFEWVRTR